MDVRWRLCVADSLFRPWHCRSGTRFQPVDQGSGRGAVPTFGTREDRGRGLHGRVVRTVANGGSHVLAWFCPAGDGGRHSHTSNRL